MVQIAHLLKLIDTYRAATGLPDTTVSYRLFESTKKLAALRAGADLQVGIFNRALLWMSSNWPEGIEWPADVQRPVAEAA